jgi:hypothetical protein
MNANENFEWNIGVLENPQNDKFLEKLIEYPPIGVLLGNINVFMNDSAYENICYYILKKDNAIIGHMRLEFIIDNIWQVKETSIKTPSQGIGIELYHFILKFGGVKNSKKIPTKKLINDTQLSTFAEQLWLSSMSKKGINLKIYDKILNKSYDVNDIGNLTDDNVKIIHPKNDVSEISDYDAVSMRFFLLAESEKNGDEPLNEHQQKWINFRQRFLNNDENFDDLYMDAVKNKLSTTILFGNSTYIR